MKRIIEHGKNIVKHIHEKGKKALIVTTTAAVLATGFNSCKPKNDFGDDKEIYNIAQEYRNTAQDFNKEHMLSLAPIVLHDDSTKTVIMFAEPGGPKCTFVYKGQNKQDVYSDISLPEHMTVYTVENGKCTRSGESVSLEEAKDVLTQITMYMKNKG